MCPDDSRLDRTVPRVPAACTAGVREWECGKGLRYFRSGSNNKRSPPLPLPLTALAGFATRLTSTRRDPGISLPLSPVREAEALDAAERFKGGRELGRCNDALRECEERSDQVIRQEKTGSDDQCDKLGGQGRLSVTGASTPGWRGIEIMHASGQPGLSGMALATACMHPGRSGPSGLSVRIHTRTQRRHIRQRTRRRNHRSPVTLRHWHSSRPQAVGRPRTRCWRLPPQRQSARPLRAACRQS